MGYERDSRGRNAATVGAGFGSPRIGGGLTESGGGIKKGLTKEVNGSCGAGPFEGQYSYGNAGQGLSGGLGVYSPGCSVGGTLKRSF